MPWRATVTKLECLIYQITHQNWRAARRVLYLMLKEKYG
jgi:hypothetical protein